ncbi:MAG: hypothetical protein LBK74_10455 [Treponema sp.]|nr:hypothetical protein [Treponema sp.]
MKKKLLAAFLLLVIVGTGAVFAQSTGNWSPNPYQPSNAPTPYPAPNVTIQHNDQVVFVRNDGSEFRMLQLQIRFNNGHTLYYNVDVQPNMSAVRQFSQESRGGAIISVVVMSWL